MAHNETAILIVQMGNSPKKEWSLYQASQIIGRDNKADIQIDERQISRQHAEISQSEQGYTIRDMGSKNGTFVNGKTIGQTPHPLRNGDEIDIAVSGKLTFVEDNATAPVSYSDHAPSIRMDLQAKRVWIGEKEVHPPLSVAQYKLLHLLYENDGHVVSRDAVIARVWSEDEADGVSEQAIDALARRLRERIAESDPHHTYVETVRGHGFRLNLADK